MCAAMVFARRSTPVICGPSEWRRWWVENSRMSCGAWHRGSRPGDRSASVEPLMSLERMRFETPDRSGLPPLSRYATLFDGETDRIARIYGDEPWLQAPLPSLSRCARLQRDVPSGSG